MTHSAQDDLATLLFTRANPHAEREAALAMAASVERTLRMATSLASVGRTIDINGLDGWVGQLTARALDLQPADGRALRLKLMELLTDLDRLEHAVRARGTGAAPA
jgi:hypothetical protein